MLICAECSTGFERSYRISSKRAARPQFCSRRCQVANQGKKADAARLSRFWEKVNKTDGCWEWTAFRNRNGYGRFQFADGHPVNAHRFAYEITYGPVSLNLFVCHKCDNPTCCRPDHLFLGTPKDNMADCVAKGRINRTFRVRGHDVNTSKLTKEQALTIYNSHESGPVLASRYGISKEAVNMIKTGKNWSWATGASRAR